MLDPEDLGSLASLLRVVHPNSSRQALLRVLVNLTAHAPTRHALLRMMMGTVRVFTEGQQQQQQQQLEAGTSMQVRKEPATRRQPLLLPLTVHACKTLCRGRAAGLPS